jgi:fructose-bisphosphate aldolase, class II
MGGYKNVMSMVKGLIEFLGVTVPVAVHLDHGTFEGAKKALDAGFTSIMFDGSHYPFAENLEKTKEVVAMCHAKGVSVEAEVGSIGGEEDGVVGMGEIADPEECRLIASTGVDMFAAGIGNIHGMYPSDWKGLNFDVLTEVSNVTGGVPLVLHGGSGIPDEMVKKAIALGVSKINVNTECQIAFANATREYILAGLDLKGKGFDPRKLLKPGCEAIKQVIRTKFELFGSINKA